MEECPNHQAAASLWHREQTASEEFANALIHGLGFLLSLGCLSVLFSVLFYVIPLR